MLEHDTIAAIATGTGGGIGIVRISGPSALKIAEAIFRPRRITKLPTTMDGYTGALGHIMINGEELDEGVLFVYRSPQSYTGEDVAELCCHGGAFVLEQVLAIAVAQGARPAGPGEFTKRAFLNGKMTLTQAEAVADLVAGEGLLAMRAAMRAKDGALHQAVSTIANTLTDTLAHLAAWVDYPEEDVEEILSSQMTHTLKVVYQELSRLMSTYQTTRMVKRGISTAIVGGVNVGKSTLMNLLSGCQRSIVTHIPGTTRDVIRETVRIGELVLDLSDTAGIRSTDDPIEQLGVIQSKNYLENADFILAVLDGSRSLDVESENLLQALKVRRQMGGLVLVLINKSDLPPILNRKEIENIFPTLEISAREGHGIELLENTISQLCGTAYLNPQEGLLSNQRQLECVSRAMNSIEKAQKALLDGITLDALSVCLEEALDALLELTGQRASYQVIERVFENFCVGK